MRLDAQSVVVGWALQRGQWNRVQGGGPPAGKAIGRQNHCMTGMYFIRIDKSKDHMRVSCPTPDRPGSYIGKQRMTVRGQLPHTFEGSPQQDPALVVGGNVLDIAPDARMRGPSLPLEGCSAEPAP